MTRAATLVLCLLLPLGACADGSAGEFAPLQRGDRAPAFGAVTLEGDSLALGSLADRPILLNVWATWCPPCREEMPALQALHDRYDARGLAVVAVSLDASAADAAAFAGELGLTMRMLHDPAGRVTRTFRTTGVPETFLIGPDGRIVRRWIGAFDPLADDVIASVESVLGQG
ncbi:MAG TPA: TlpA disulfide reductase family protein [Longimicrobiales bacterium]|nr:TlpA disulfide reductase family protein [Longimicrobiales bacterium]